MNILKYPKNQGVPEAVDDFKMSYQTSTIVR